MSAEGNKKVIGLLARTMGNEGMLQALLLESRFPGTIEAGLEYAAQYRKKPAMPFFVSSARDIAMDEVITGVKERLSLCSDDLAELEETLAEISFNPDTLKVREYVEESSWTRETQRQFAKYFQSGDPDAKASFVEQVACDAYAANIISDDLGMVRDEFVTAGDREDFERSPVYEDFHAYREMSL